jgi:hypothetical protein
MSGLALSASISSAFDNDMTDYSSKKKLPDINN